MKKYILITHIDLQSAFGFIDHVRLFIIMLDMGYPTDVVEIVGYLTLKLPHVSNENHLDAPTL
jgi:hypothetical protein